MRFLYLTLITILCSVGNYSQNWSWQNPRPQGNFLSSVRFINEEMGWAVGYTGTILKTTDGGDNWLPKQSGTNEWLYSVQFIDANIGWAVGFGGTILKSINGGDSWQIQNSGATNFLLSVYFTDVNNGCAVGYNGTIIKTTDGGNTWTSQTSGVNSRLYSVHFTSQNVGYIVDDAGGILKTENSGNSWYSLTTGNVNWLHCITFINETTGWAIGNLGTILKTTNSGNNWVKQTSGTGNFLLSAQFVDLNFGWAVGDNGTLLRTSDGGDHWFPQISGTTVHLSSLFFNSVNIGYAVGVWGTILKTTNGGQNWFSQSSSSTSKDLWSTHFIDLNNGYAVGSNGTIVHTSDGGNNWESQSSETALSLFTVFFTNFNTGWAVGDDGLILKTNDGGNDWNSQNSGTLNAFHAGHFVDSSTGWIVGELAEIQKTTNGGLNWVVQSPPASLISALYDVYFIDANKGWACGAEGKIIHTTDGGSNWVFQSSGVATYLWSMHFINETTGWVVGEGGRILKTTNGGSSWESQNSGTTIWFHSVYFATPNNGKAVGAEGKVVTTTNGGNTWETQESGTQNNIYDIHLVTSNLGWVVGQDGTIIKFDGNLPTLNLNSPLGGESWAVGSSHNITWTQTNVTNIKLEYTTNNGTSWIQIASSTPSSAGSYSWTIPNTISSNCKVKITDVNNASVFDQSDSPFTITNYFEEVTSVTFPGLEHSAVAWADFNNDGNVDLILTGQTNSGNIAKVYKNIGDGTFIEQSSIVISATASASVQWGDFNNDGYLDILISGFNSDNTGWISKVYKNDNGIAFAEVAQNQVQNCHNGSSRWGDYDNDGDLDILLTGGGGVGEYFAKVYRNNGNETFTELGSLSLTGLNYSASEWGDYDNDGDLDILTTGYSLEGIISRIYRNDAGSGFLFQSQILLTGVWEGTAIWADFNADSFLDISLTGKTTEGSLISKIFRNNGDNTFTEQVNIPLEGVYLSSAQWGDFNNDGSNDIIISGWNTSEIDVTKFYKNNGDNTFSNIDVPLQPVRVSSVAAADYNNDGALDVIVSGLSASGRFTKLYRNHQSVTNSPPISPANLMSNVGNGIVNFSWYKSSDDHTPQIGLHYNIAIGTSPGNYNILSPMSDVGTGKRRISRIGNCQSNNWYIKGLQPGTYYWTVQAIDGSYLGSQFAQEQSFSVSQTSNYSLYFDGVDNYITNMVEDKISANDPFTVEAWIKMENANLMGIINRGPTWSYNLYSTDNGSTSLYWGINDNEPPTYVNYVVPNVNTWHHVAGTKSNDGKINLFVDGVLMASKNYVTGIIPTNGTTLQFGKYFNDLSFFFKGWMTKIRISKVARYTSGFTPITNYVVDSNTVGQWDFSEGAGIFLFDSGPNQIHGNINGGAIWSTDFPTVQTGLTLNSPNGGENWTVGSNNNITWTQTGIANVKLEYTSNNGTSWNQIVASTNATTGSYSWTIPNSVSTNCKVKITDVSNSSISDQSNNTFSISQVSAGNFSLYFDGIDDFVGNIIENKIRDNSSFTLELWVKNQSSGNAPLITRGANSGVDWSYNLYALDRLYFGVNSAPGYVSSPPPSLNQWHHIAAVNNADGFLWLFIDGVKVAELNHSATTLTQSFSLQFGKYFADGSSDYFKGNLTKIRISKVVRYNSNFTPPITYSVDTNTIGQWDFSEGSGTTLNDNSVNQLDGAISGAIWSTDFPTVQTGLTLNSPNGGENWTVGSTHNITWTQTGVANVKLEYTTNNGTIWIQIVSSTPGSVGSYSWTIPNTVSTNCRVKITDIANSSVSDESNNLFSIYLTSTGDYSLHFDGEEDFVGGMIENRISGTTPFTIEFWIKSDSVAGGEYRAIINRGANAGVDWSYNIFTQYSLLNFGAASGTGTGGYTSGFIPNTNTWYHIAAVRTSSGVLKLFLDGNKIGESALDTFNLTPTYELRFGKYLSEALGSYFKGFLTRIRLSKIERYTSTFIPPTSYTLDTNTVGQWDFSEGTGTILYDRSGSQINGTIYGATWSTEFPAMQSAITLTSPNGGESWQVGSSHDITWTQNNVSNIKIEFTTNNGSSWIQVVASTPATTGSHSWTIPNTVSTFCKIRVTDVNNNSISDQSNAVFTISAPAPSVAISSPNGGENWIIGSSHNITWTQTGITNVKLEYTADNGTNWYQITASTSASTGSYSWTIPNAVSTQCRVRITDVSNSSISSQSNSFFSISQNSSVTVTSPNGGENWVVGSSHNITWTSSNVSNVRLEFTTNNGNIWSSITTSTSATTGSYAWTIPNAVSSNCKIRVTNTENTVITDQSNAVFTISAAPAQSITLTSPNGGENWQVGSSHNITWTLAGVINVKLEFTTDNGLSWSQIVGSTFGGDGIYSWTIPNTISESCKVKITDVLNGSVTDQSNSVFVISAESVYSITVTSPNGGENWFVGNQYSITWNSVNVENLKLEYSVNDGNEWTQIVDSVPANLGSYIWTIPNLPSSTCKMRISSLENGSINDISDSNFTISVTPAVALTSPNGGENWLVGKQYSITWTSINVQNLKIEYSTNNGILWNTIEGSTPAGPGSYIWTIPNSVSVECLVRLSSTDNSSVADQSDQPFTIDLERNLTLVSPSGGEVFTSGEKMAITWNSLNLETIDLYYSVDNGGYWGLIADSVDASLSTFNWDIPENNSNQVKIRLVYTRKTELRSEIVNTFTILPSPKVTLQSNLSGAFLKSGANQLLEWFVENISAVNLFYSSDGGTVWNEIALNIPSTTRSHNWVVPQLNSKNCRIKVVSSVNPDLSNSSAGYFTIYTYSESISLVNTWQFGDIKDINNYRLVSMPGNTTENLVNVISGKHIEEWNAYWDNGNDVNYQVQYDGSEIFKFQPGKGFWVLSKNPINLNKQLAAVTIDSTLIFNVSVHRGWNIIGNPFAKSLNWSEIRSINSLPQNRLIYYWDGKWNFPTQMEPFKGYYFFNEDNRSNLKFVYPVEASLAKTGMENQFRNFSAGISISFGENEIFAVFNEAATTGLDTNDYLLPGITFSNKNLSFLRDTEDGKKRQLFIESQPMDSLGNSFRIRATNTSGEAAHLQIKPRVDLGANNIYLLDEKYQEFIDVRSKDKFTIIPQEESRYYTLLIGSDGFIKSVMTKYLPTEYILYQNYPNPFNPETSIKYALPEDSQLKIKLYDILGNEVITLFEGEEPAGVHTRTFDLSSFASGVYLYRMETRNKSFVKKMVLMK